MLREVQEARRWLEQFFEWWQPETLDRGPIAATVGAARSKFLACGQTSSATGSIRVTFKVNSNGRVASSGDDHALNACVGRREVLAFPKSQKGITFHYPFTFGATN